MIGNGEIWMNEFGGSIKIITIWDSDLKRLVPFRFAAAG
jgi:hypothetical protein